MKTEVWHRGSKSFCNWFRWQGKNIVDQNWVEAPRGEQLPEEVFDREYMKFVRAEAANPAQHWHWIRYDHEDIVPENDNNAPLRFVDGEWRKHGR